MRQGRSRRVLRVSLRLEGTDLLDQFVEAVRHTVPLAWRQDPIDPKSQG